MKQHFKQLVACVASAVLVVGCGGGNEPAGSSQQQLAKSVAVAAAINHDANFPAATLQFLKEKTGLDGEQWDNIMRVVNKPEQDSPDWNKFYGYCEDIKDDRGYTIGIFGATTGGSNDGNPDGPALFTAFDAANGAAVPSVAGGLQRAGVNGVMNGKILKITDTAKVFCKQIKGLQNNPAWQDAMWKTFYSVYIDYTIQQATQRGYTSALTIGSFLDTALNQGADGGENTLEGLLSRTSGTDEAAFLTDFYAKRTLVVDTHQFNQAPNGAHRVKQWSDLKNLGLFTLKDADAAVAKVTKWTLK
ncbi:chitosanase [Janthinobacterium agaricidamnosum]|uniref:Chitosanase n=1 Tax=Janthinobacterium agaricidamnosum NBRC 102515 = DSM 9628 TaxID=1349767 RepID=W0V0V5_9BURK|nr:chitosanase [Janthinobacterium agaricidamnosum]CDG82439.1 chitosanase [Janthinobacterium agaricidamnosum NBRC 102515 = DSM 9628]